MRATEKYFPIMLWCYLLCLIRVILAFESVDQIVECDHYWFVLSFKRLHSWDCLLLSKAKVAYLLYSPHEVVKTVASDLQVKHEQTWFRDVLKVFGERRQRSDGETLYIVRNFYTDVWKRLPHYPHRKFFILKGPAEILSTNGYLVLTSRFRVFEDINFSALKCF